MKCQSSFKNSMGGRLRKGPHGVGRRPGRGAHDPIGLAAPTRIEAQGVTAARPHDQCGGEDPENEDHPHDDRRHDVVKDQANLEPELVERLQQARPYDCDHEEESRERKRPQVRSATRYQGPKCDDRKDGGKNEAEGAVRGGVFDLAPVEVLVCCSHAQTILNSAATRQSSRCGTAT